MSKASATWLRNLAPAVGAVGGVLVAVGIYLLDPRVLDLGLTVDAERTWLIGAFLIAAGAALAFKAAWPNGLSSGSVLADLLGSLVIGQLSHFAFGGIQTALGVQALLATPLNLWVAALLVPGLLSLAIALVDEKTRTEGGGADAGDETSPKSGQVNFGAVGLFSLIYGSFWAIYMFAAFVWIVLAFWLYHRLNGIIFSNETFSTAAAAVSLWEAVVDALPRMVPIAIVIAVVVALATLAGVLFQLLSQRGARDGNRDLSAAEAAYINTSAETVGAYAKAQGYDRNVWVVQTFGVISVFVAIAVGAVATFSGISILEAPPAGSAFPIMLRPGGFSAVAWLFVILVLSPLPNSILSRLSRRYSERAGWVSIGVKNEHFSLKGKLTTLVRARRLSIATPVDPGAFLHEANLSFERFFYVTAAALAAVTLFFTHRDLNAVNTLTADAIEITDYWTLAQKRFSYGDVRQVELRCFLTDKGETAEAYELQFKDGQTLDIYGKQAAVEAKVDAYEAVDAKLRALGVPFVPGAHKGWFKSGERGYDPDCVAKLAEYFPEQARSKVRHLFHLDEMKAVEDIWPWDAELASAKTASEAYAVEKAVAIYTKAINSGRLSGHLLSIAHFGRSEARFDYEVAHGIRDAELILALRDYQKAREIEPTKLLYRREGMMLIALGAYDEAKAAFRKELELDQPKPHWSLIDLSRVERVQGNYDAAMKLLDELLRVWGEDNASMPIYFHRAWVLYLKNDNAGAVDAITKGLAYQTDYDGAYRQRACAYARLGDFAKARADIAEAIKLAHAPPINEAWEKTPYARAYYAELERDRTLIDAMSAGTAAAEERAALCQDMWNYGQTLRSRSPLLSPPQ